MGLAVSGGPDSLALLLLAHALLPDRIEVATVDHQLRAESAAETAFVSEFCKKLHVPTEILTVVVEQGNLQASARRARYQALAKWGNERLAVVATAHHADDQAETLLMRLNRGAGLSGLSGIRARSQLSVTDCALVRPLLGWRKRELEELVSSAELNAVRDPSNDDDNFERARLRKQLEGIDWLDIAAITRSVGHLTEAEDEIVGLCAMEILAAVHSEGKRTTYVPKASNYIRKRVVQMIFGERGKQVSMTQAADLVAKLQHSGKGNLAGILASSANGVWTFEPEPPRRTA